MTMRVEVCQFEYLRVEHLRIPPKLNVDRCDTRFLGMLRSVVGRAICELLLEKVAYNIPVFIVKNNDEYVGGYQVPFIVVNSDDPEQATKAVKALNEYFTEDVKVMVIPLMRLY